MLAEPRRRQKYSINPRGLDWSNDEAKVGQKLLEKMGWRKGKALGLNEDGCKEHIKVSTKSDRKGVGCTQQHADNWIAHQEDFNSILSALNKDVTMESSSTAFSLNDTSKNSRSRVHYQKFAKGKDLTGYHSTDLNCIFGERKKVARAEHRRTSKVEVQESSGESNEDKKSFGVLTVTSSTSIDNYFAAKLAKLRSKAQQNAPVSEKVSQTTNDIATSCNVTNDECQEQERTEQQLKSRTVKQCKKKQRKVDSDCPLESNGTLKKKKKKRHDDSDLTGIIVDHSNDGQNQQTVKTMKKSKKARPVATEDTGFGNSEHDIIAKKRKKSKHVDR